MFESANSSERCEPLRLHTSGCRNRHSSQIPHLSHESAHQNESTTSQYKETVKTKNNVETLQKQESFAP
jgi:hypothetical protein